MSYSTKCKERGIPLEVNWYRKYWRKRIKGHTPFYFKHSDTKEGYEAALREWILEKAKIDGERPYADVWHHHRQLFQIVETYWEQFGKDRSEATLAKEVRAFLESIDNHLEQPELRERIGIGGLGKQFRNEFMRTLPVYFVVARSTFERRSSVPTIMPSMGHGSAPLMSAFVPPELTT